MERHAARPLREQGRADRRRASTRPTSPPTRRRTWRPSTSLKAAGVQGEWVDGYVFTGTFEFQCLLWQFGGDLYNKDVTEATFNSEAGVKALTWMPDLINDGYSPANVAQDGNIKALLAGKTAFNWNGVWQTTNTAFDRLDWAAAPVPQIGTEKAVWSELDALGVPGQQGPGQEQDGRRRDLREVDERQLGRLGRDRRAARAPTPCATTRHWSRSTRT